VITFALGVVGTPGAHRTPSPDAWVAYLATGLILLAITCVTIYRWWVVDGRGHGGGDSDDDDEGGGPGRGRGRIPPEGSPGGDPQWWPEFEGQFAEHVRSRLGVGADTSPAGPARVGAPGPPAPR
jgi:hypothetical protein